MKKLKLFNYSILLFLTVLCTLGSCSKEIKEKNIDNLNPEGIFVLTNVDEYTSVINQVLSMDASELKAFEEARGYKSFGRICDEFYKSIDIESFKSTDEIIAFADKHSDILRIVEEDGDLYLETVLSDRPDRYFINKDKIYVVGDRFFKLTDDGRISGNLDYIEEANNINSKEDIPQGLTDEILFSSFEVKPLNLKDAANNCGTGLQQIKVTNDNERIKMELNLYNTIRGDYFGLNASYYEATMLSRPLHLFAGIWWRCSRTMRADFKVRIDHCLNPNNWQAPWFKNTYTTTFGPEETNAVEYYVGPYYYGMGSWEYDAEVHYGAYDLWSDNDEVSPANLECNKSHLY